MSIMKSLIQELKQELKELWRWHRSKWDDIDSMMPARLFITQASTPVRLCLGDINKVSIENTMKMSIDNALKTGNDMKIGNGVIFVVAFFKSEFETAFLKKNTCHSAKEAPMDIIIVCNPGRQSKVPYRSCNKENWNGSDKIQIRRNIIWQKRKTTAIPEVRLKSVRLQNAHSKDGSRQGFQNLRTNCSECLPVFLETNLLIESKSAEHIGMISKREDEMVLLPRCS